jgi:hypothetical protein
MSIYSGFITSFNNTLPSAPYTDLMSEPVPLTGTNGSNYGTWCTGSAGSAGTLGPLVGYMNGYMYIGSLLVQFTRINASGLLPNPGAKGGIVTINYPKPFGGSSGSSGGGGAYFILANPISINNSGTNYTVTVLTSAATNFTAMVGNDNYGYIQYLAIGPQP